MTRTAIRISGPALLPALGVLAAFLSGCGTMAQVRDAEARYCAGRYGEAESVMRDTLAGPAEAGELGKPSHILENLYAGSAALMAGDTAGAREDFANASDGIDRQEHSSWSFLSSSYQATGYDAVMSENYQALARWMDGSGDQVRVAFRRVADAQEKTVEKNARAIRKARDEAEKRRREGASDSESGGLFKSISHTLNSGANKKALDGFQGDFDAWGAYDSYQNPAAWFLDAVFSLANAEDASDLEHASFAARKAYAMAPSAPAKSVFELAEARADGKIPASALSGVTIVVFENGLCPAKEEKRFDYFFPYNHKVYHVGMALPNLVKRPAAYPKLILRDGETPLGETIPIADFDRVAVTEFKAKLPGIIAYQVTEAAIRLAAQIAATEYARKKNNDDMAALVSIVGSALSAIMVGTDTRNWNLLPKEYQAVAIQKPLSGWLSVCVPGGTAPIALVELPKDGMSVVYVKVPAPGLPPLVKILGG